MDNLTVVQIWHNGNLMNTYGQDTEIEFNEEKLMKKRCIGATENVVEILFKA